MNSNHHLDRIHTLNLEFAAIEQKLLDEIARLKNQEQAVSAKLAAAQGQAARDEGEQNRLVEESRQVGQELQALLQTLAQREQQLEALFSTQTKREGEVAAQLLDVHQQTLQGKADLARSYGEQEQALNQKLQALQEQQGQLQQERVTREQALLEQAAQAKQEVENILRTQVQREQAVAEKLEAMQAKVAQEGAQLGRSLTEQQHALHGQHIAREEALRQQLDAVKLEHITREQTLLEQATQAKQEVENILRTQVQREQSVVEKLEAVRSQATQENTELTRNLAEQQHTLHSQHRAREQALGQQLEAEKQERSKREKTLQEQASQAKQEVENLLRTQAQREREVLTQLLAVQQQATREKAELTRSHLTKERELVSQQIQREKSLTQQLHAHQQELRNLQKDRVKREQEAAQEKVDLTRRHSDQEHALLCQQADREKAQSLQLITQQEEFRQLQLEQSKHEQALLELHSQTRQQLQTLQETVMQREQEVLAQLHAIQQHAAHEKAELLQKQSEQDRALHLQHTEREAALALQLQELQQLLQHQQEGWAQLEQTLHHAKQLQAQQHSLELSTQLDERNHLLEAYVTLDAQLQVEIKSGQQISLLHQLLAELHHSLEITHTSLSWRMTAPLRKLAGLFNSNMNQTPLPTSFSVQIKPELPMQFATRSPSITVNQASLEPTMQPLAPATSLNMPTIASTLPELLACHGQHFVQCAYRTLLGREPDLEGMAYYLGQLRTGYSKMRIVTQLCSSKECKVHAAQLTGLAKAIQFYHRGQQPLLGGLFRWLDGTEGNRPTERKLRGIENQLSMLSDESNRRLNQIETALAGLHHLVVQQTQSVVIDLGGKPKSSLNSATTAPTQPAALNGLKQLSSRARDIYFQLKTAATVHAGRAA